MLENDLVLTRFLDARGATLTEDEVALLDRLLDLADNELWDLIAGRAGAGRSGGCARWSSQLRGVTHAAVPHDRSHQSRRPSGAGV